MLPCASSTSQPEGLQRPSRGPAEGLHNSNAVPPQGLWRACAGPAEGLQNSRAIYDPVVLQGLKKLVINVDFRHILGNSGLRYTLIVHKNPELGGQLICNLGKLRP